MIRSALCVLLACICGLFLASCGEADDATGDAAAASILRQTSSATSQIENAKLAASFRLQADGPLALAGPIVVRASGPFAAPSAAGRMPRFDMAVAGTLGGMPVRAGAISTGGKLFLRLGEQTYRVDDELVREVRDALASAKGGGLASLGLDPATWIKDPQVQGTARVGGVETEKIVGEIDVEKALADIGRLLDGAGTGEFLGPRMRAKIAAAVKSSRVELWTGTQDHILRQVAIAVDFKFDDRNGARSMGLAGGRMNLRLRLDDVNETDVKIATPKGARALSSLAGAGGMGALLGGLNLGGTGAATPADGGKAFLKCLESAQGTAADISRCASKLQR